ncbi:NnrU family protein [Aestuariivirga sp.]|uniref:NnrU family protein n=1 Tax=Aestuariivirga sp. TaxID=2650926 RepID=UPI0039E28BF4
MILLFLALVVFAAVHLVPVFPGIKDGLIARFGRKAFGALMSVTGLFCLALLVAAWRNAPSDFAYVPGDWGRYANFALSLLGVICVSIFIFRGSLRQRLRFPLGIGVVLWALGHLLANGDTRSLLLFGGLGALAIAQMMMAAKHGVRPSPEVRSGHDLLSIVIGVALFGILTQLHAFVVGVPILKL